MSLTGTFNAFSVTTNPESRQADKPKRPAPFSLRLTAEERARLLSEAKGAPLGAYIKAKLLGGTIPIRTRRFGLAVEDRQSLAQALALLGRSRLANNLNQLAHLAHIGALPVTPEVEAELQDGICEIRALRRLLLRALGLKAEDEG
ncbi:hypothetical protein GGE65_005441 [Skermanella aerolata]|uniref:plasmid mobilization relaxosome protein MobC n=1 Tax=Skermanella aerolata TaxID=393310 RepID=UPI003D2084EF